MQWTVLIMISELLSPSPSRLPVSERLWLPCFAGTNPPGPRRGKRRMGSPAHPPGGFSDWSVTRRKTSQTIKVRRPDRSTAGQSDWRISDGGGGLTAEILQAVCQISCRFPQSV